MDYLKKEGLSMKEQNVSIKLKIMCAFLTTLFIISIFITLSRGGVLPISEKDILSEDRKNNVAAEADYYTVCAGNIIDKNGDPIQENILPCKDGEVSDSYGLIVGYYNPFYGSFGLRGKYKGLMQTEYRKTGKGISLKLTTDNTLQEYIYNQFKGRDASAVVLERQSGKLLALISTNSTCDFNPANIYDYEIMKKYNSINHFWYPNYTLDEPAGSVMKTFTSASMLESDIEDFIFNDSGILQYKDGEIKNHNESAYGDTDLKNSFVSSVNTYFAAAAQKLGHYRMDSLSKKLLFNNEIDCDFGTVSSTFNLGNTSYDLASAGYGQGKTLNSTMSLALMLQGLCEQQIFKPHILDCLYVYLQDEQKKIDSFGEVVLSKDVVSKSTSQAIDELMLAASESYGLPSELGIRSKTGTADTSENEAKPNRATFLSYNDNYIVVLSEHNTDQFGISLADEAIEIYKFLSTLN